MRYSDKEGGTLGGALDLRQADHFVPTQVADGPAGAFDLTVRVKGQGRRTYTFLFAEDVAERWLVLLASAVPESALTDALQQYRAQTVVMKILATTLEHWPAPRFFWRLWSRWWPHRSQRAGQHAGAQA